jgi:hypothetical protein
MGMYISFATKPDEDSVFYTTRLSRDVFTDIANIIPSVSFDELGKFHQVDSAELDAVRNEFVLNAQRWKERIALTLFKREYDELELQSDIEYYENLLVERGMIMMLVDMSFDHGNKLYVSVG